MRMLNQVETLRTSHNSHTHNGITHRSKPQLKGYHFEPQLNECSSKSIFKVSPKAL